MAPLSSSKISRRGVSAAGTAGAAAGTAINYVGSVFLPAFAATELKLPLISAQYGLMFMSLANAALVLVFGLLSDRIGRRAVLVPALIVYCILYFVLLKRLVAEPTVAHLWQLQAIGVLLGAEDVVFGMRARLLVMLLWGEALVVGGLGLYAAMLPRRRGEMDCHTCGYHLDGLEMSGPRGDTITCPECGQPWKRPEVVELTPIPKGPRRKRTGI